jgi:Pectate lyase superfamily protein
MIALSASLILVGPAAAMSEDRSGTNVRRFGAIGDGYADDTRAFLQAIAEAHEHGLVFLPEGKFRLSSTIVITKPVKIVGTGFSTQIYNNNNQTLFQLVNVNNVEIRDLYLGSSSTQSGVSLIELVNSHHNQINNVTMLGGYYGLHLKGSLLNTVIDMRSGANFGGFFAKTSITNTWVMGEPYNQISANANTFIAPVLEGGVNGVVMTDNTAQGSIHIFGGTMEGITGTALTFQKTGLNSSITGVHFESNGVDIVTQAASNIRISSIVSVTPGQINLLGDTRNVSITDSIANNISIDIGDAVYPGASLGAGSGTGAKRIILQNITTCVSNPSVISPAPTGDPYFGGQPNGPSSPMIPNPAEGGAPRKDIIYTNIGRVCGGG